MEKIDRLSDEELREKFLHKTVRIEQNGVCLITGVVDGFSGAAIADDKNRSIIGFIINNETISISDKIIVEILN